MGTKRPSAVKRFRKLSVFRSRGHQGVLNSSVPPSRRPGAAPLRAPVASTTPTLQSASSSTDTGKMGAVLLRTSSLVLRVANAAPLGRFHTRSTLISHVLLLADCIDRACNREMARDWYRVRFFASFLWKTRYTLSPMLLRKERTFSSVITFSIERFLSTRCKFIGFPSFPR